MSKKSPTDSWDTALYLNPNLEKKYMIPTRINDIHAWILPANFFILSHEWTIIFEFDQVCIYLKMDSGALICLQKKMCGAKMNQFEKEWLAFQSSHDRSFDLQGFNFLN